MWGLLDSRWGHFGRRRGHFPPSPAWALLLLWCPGWIYRSVIAYARWQARRSGRLDLAWLPVWRQPTISALRTWIWSALPHAHVEITRLHFE